MDRNRELVRPELGLPRHPVIPGIAEFARGGLPDPAATDDGNHWVDGTCWLYCGQRQTRVLWIGPVSVAGAQAPMYACGLCIGEIQERVWESLQLHDNPGYPAHRPECSREDRSGVRGRGRHRRSRT
ncbi:hypothetical protein ACIA8F_02005 [Streptomyces sp. NPDC051563]|uniref:hypothetical protein n=1 Tax=Streptomyces sp. NPDC051563 TaxID=3365659 RepID=UPI00378CDC21